MNFRGSAGLDFTVLPTNSGQFKCPEPRIPVGGVVNRSVAQSTPVHNPKKEGKDAPPPISPRKPVVSREAVEMVARTLAQMKAAKSSARKKKKFRKEGRARVWRSE